MCRAEEDAVEGGVGEKLAGELDVSVVNGIEAASEEADCFLYGRKWGRHRDVTRSVPRICRKA